MTLARAFYRVTKAKNSPFPIVLSQDGVVVSSEGVTRCDLIFKQEDQADVVISSDINPTWFDLESPTIYEGISTKAVRVDLIDTLADPGRYEVDVIVWDDVSTSGRNAGTIDVEIGGRVSTPFGADPMDLFGNWRLPHDTPQTLTADVDNYNLLVNAHQRLSSDAERTITGITRIAGGQFRLLTNVGVNNIVLAHENVNSTALNRFITNTEADVILYPNQSIILIYDSVSARWRMPPVTPPLYRISDAESAAGLTDDDLTRSYYYGDVRRYGVSSSGSASVNAAGLQNAVNANYGKALFIPGETFDYDTTLQIVNEINIFGEGEASLLNYTAADATDAIDLSTTAYLNRLAWRDFKITSGASAGHCINIGFGIVGSLLENISLSALNTAKGLINGSFTSEGGVYGSRFVGGHWLISTSHTVPAVKLVSDGNRINTNVFREMRCDRSGDEGFFHLECTSGSTWLYTNRFIHLEAEVVDKGFIKLLGCKDAEISSLVYWDAAGAISGHVIELGSSASGRSCRSCKIEKYHRTAGALDGGIYDVSLTDADDTLFVNCGSTNSDTAFDVNSKRVAIVGPEISETWDNLNVQNSTWISNDFVRTPVLQIANFGLLTIASGVVTASGNYHRVAVETGSTDDLDTINGGEDGMRLVLRANSGSETVVVKNGTGNIACGSDFSLDNAFDTVELLYDDLLSKWLMISSSDNGA